MPEGRDRLSRDDDIMGAWRGGSIPFILDDGDEEGQSIISPFRWRGTPMVGSPRLGSRRGEAQGSPRIRRFSPIRGPENFSPVAGRGRGRGPGSALPTWYPRRPLNDITAVMRAIERRREHQRDGDVLESESRIHQDPYQLEHNISMISPRPTLSTKCCPPATGKCPRILLDINHKNDENSSLTPEKKLLIMIDSVEKVVMEELRKMKRTPSAKKAERVKRVRTLMSMR